MMEHEPTTLEEWHEIRREAALHIDPNTAEVAWRYGCKRDPYNVCFDLPEDFRQVGRVWFARAPGSDVWVWFGHLPGVVRKALWDKLNYHVVPWPTRADLGDPDEDWR